VWLASEIRASSRKHDNEQSTLHVEIHAVIPVIYFFLIKKITMAFEMIVAYYSDVLAALIAKITMAVSTSVAQKEENEACSTTMHKCTNNCLTVCLIFFVHACACLRVHRSLTALGRPPPTSLSLLSFSFSPPPDTSFCYTR
jgi:hypothetical protein